MHPNAPHYLLLTEGSCTDREPQWRFVLQGIDSETALTASDSEALADSERAELLAVVRGLEALEQPARVTLITRSRYVQQGLARGLQEWRDSDWQWERFGRMVPVRDCDLWQRIDQALQFHTVECRCWRFDDAEPAFSDRPHGKLAGPHFIRRRSIRYRETAANSDAKPEMTMRLRNEESRWLAASMQRLYSSASRAVTSPLAAS